MATENHIFRRIKGESKTAQLVKILQERPNSGSGRKLSKVGQIASIGMGLKVSCHDCGHMETFPATELAEKFGADTDLSDLREPCSACGSAVVDRLPC